MEIPSVLLRSSILVSSLLLVFVLGACAKPLPPPIPKTVAEMALLLDVSDSSVNVSKTSMADFRCPEATARIRQVLGWPGVRHLDVAIFATGDMAATNGEPTVVLPWTRFSATQHTFGKQVSRTTQEHEFLASVEKRCRDTLQPTASSPIVLGWQRMRESLDAHEAELDQCGERVGVKVLSVASDLRETGHPIVRQYLADITKALSRRKSLPVRPVDLPIIDLTGLRVQMCGTSEHLAEPTEATLSAQAVNLGWREILGGKAPAFDAACPRDPTLVATTIKSKVRP